MFHSSKPAQQLLRIGKRLAEQDATGGLLLLVYVEDVDRIYGGGSSADASRDI